MASFTLLLRLYCCFGILFLQWNDKQRFANAFVAVAPKNCRQLLNTDGSTSLTPPCHIATHFAASDNQDLEEPPTLLLSEEEEKLQRELDSMMNPTKQESFGFNAENFDQSALPVPLFTGLLIMVFSLYMTGYFLYVGINGFPGDDTFPRPF